MCPSTSTKEYVSELFEKLHSRSPMKPSADAPDDLPALWLRGLYGKLYLAHRVIFAFWLF